MAFVGQFGVYAGVSGDWAVPGGLVSQREPDSYRQFVVVCYHNLAFSSSHQHYTEQSVRLRQPLFEACGGDVVFGGHIHNYQRTVTRSWSSTRLRTR